MGDANEKGPALPGEVWRGEWDGCVWSIDEKREVHVWWPAAGLKWDAHPATASEVLRVFKVAFVAERNARVKAEALAKAERAYRVAREADDLARDMHAKGRGPGTNATLQRAIIDARDALIAAGGVP